jgi:hypothetical protein
MPHTRNPCAVHMLELNVIEVMSTIFRALQPIIREIFRFKYGSCQGFNNVTPSITKSYVFLVHAIQAYK